MRHRDWTIGLGLLVIVPAQLSGQTPTRIELSSPTASVAVGDRVQLSATAFDSAGNAVEVQMRFYTSARRNFPVSRDGLLQPIMGGEFVAYVRVNTARNVRDSIVFLVDFPPVREVNTEPADPFAARRLLRRGDGAPCGDGHRRHGHVADRRTDPLVDR